MTILNNNRQCKSIILIKQRKFIMIDYATNTVQWIFKQLFNEQMNKKTFNKKEEPLASGCVLSSGLSFFINNASWIFVLY